jgi:putative transposase
MPKPNGRPKKFEIEVTEAERAALKEISQSRSMPHGVVRRVQMILLSAERQTNSAIARRFHVSVPTVAHWRERFKANGLVGLYGEQRFSGASW